MLGLSILLLLICVPVFSTKPDEKVRCQADCKLYKKLDKLQAKLQSTLSTCRFDAASKLVSGSFSYSLINKQTCSVDNTTDYLQLGDFASFFGQFNDYDQVAHRYVCHDNTKWLIPKADYIKNLANGTVVISKLLVNVNPLDFSKVTSIAYDFHWSPTKGCKKYRLSYATGHNLLSPSFQLDIPRCGCLIV